MSLAEAFAPAENKYRNQVLANTWGHLAPKPQNKYEGYILFTLGAYGDITVIDCEFKDLDDSPWFYDHMYDFVCNNSQERASTYLFEGTYTMFKNGKCRFSGKILEVEASLLARYISDAWKNRKKR